MNNLITNQTVLINNLIKNVNSFDSINKLLFVIHFI